MRVFVEPDNLPIVVHCIHGKDRTGLIIALVLLLVGLEEETVVLDYAKSEVMPPPMLQWCRTPLTTGLKMCVSARSLLNRSPQRLAAGTTWLLVQVLCCVLHNMNVLMMSLKP